MALDHTHVRLFGEERLECLGCAEEAGNRLVRPAAGLPDLRRRVATWCSPGFYASNDTYDHQTFTQAQMTRANDVMRELDIESFAPRHSGTSRRGSSDGFSSAEPGPRSPGTRAG